MIAASGSFDVAVDDGTARARYSLNRSYTGLYIPPMVWRELANFSSGSVALVLASEHYDEADYYRDYDEFPRLARRRERPGGRAVIPVPGLDLGATTPRLADEIDAGASRVLRGGRYVLGPEVEAFEDASAGTSARGTAWASGSGSTPCTSRSWRWGWGPATR